MASEALECSICCERFDDQTHCPRLLSCGHSFSSDCLERLVNEKAINCPTCRNAVSVPAGVAGLPKNFALLDILLTMPQKQEKDESTPVCEICDHEQHPATSCCLDCKENMCNDVARLHTRQKATRDHHVVSLEELKANPKLAAMPVFCPEHNAQFRFFDEDCGHAVCRDCVTLKHNGHKCSSIAEAASRYRQEMEALVTKANTHAEAIKAAEARVDGVSHELKQAYKIQAALIQGTFKEVRFYFVLFCLNVAVFYFFPFLMIFVMVCLIINGLDVFLVLQLIADVTAREQLLLNELGNLYKTKSLTLIEQRDRLRAFHACLKIAVHRANTAIQSPGNAELLVARSDIVSTLGALERQPLVLEPQSSSKLKFAFDLRQLLDLLGKVGFVLGNTASAVNTTATGLGLKYAAKGRESSFTITAHDDQGRLCSLGGDIFVVELKHVKGEKTVDVNVKDNGNGTYLATYTAPAGTKGNYTISVLSNGSHIQGSPFTVQLVPVGRVDCYWCGSQSASMMYYRNNEPNRTDTMRGGGFSALCHPECSGLLNRSWVFVCGPL